MKLFPLHHTFVPTPSSVLVNVVFFILQYKLIHNIHFGSKPFISSFPIVYSQLLILVHTCSLSHVSSKPKMRNRRLFNTLTIVTLPISPFSFLYSIHSIYMHTTCMKIQGVNASSRKCSTFFLETFSLSFWFLDTYTHTNI